MANPEGGYDIIVISSGSPSSPESGVSGDSQVHRVLNMEEIPGEKISFHGRQSAVVGDLRRIVLAVGRDGAGVTKV